MLASSGSGMVWLGSAFTWLVPVLALRGGTKFAQRANGIASFSDASLTGRLDNQMQ